MSMIGFLLGTCTAFFVVMGDLAPPIVARVLGIEPTDNLRLFILVGKMIVKRYATSQLHCTVPVVRSRSVCGTAAGAFAQRGELGRYMYGLNRLLPASLAPHRCGVLAQARRRFVGGLGQLLASSRDISVSANLLHGLVLSAVSTRIVCQCRTEQ